MKNIDPSMSWKRSLLVACLIILSSCRTESTRPSTVVQAVESSGASCAISPLIDYPNLQSITAFPNPFRMMNGKLMTKKSEWVCRRAQVSKQLQFYELGEKPDAKTAVVSAVVDADKFVVTVEEGGKSISFTATIQWPTNGGAPYPAMIGIGRPSLNNAELLSRGIAIINFPNNDLGEQLNGSSRGKGKFFDLYNERKDASAMVAWAWGVSRLIDALEKTPAAQIDSKHLGVTGCSRNGKGALMVGALDERIALTIPQESGSGGSASWRVSDAQLTAGQNVQTLRQIVNENVWFRDSFKQFSLSADRLPFDHHQVLGLVAPRGLLVIENTSMEWLGNQSGYTTALAAREIWKALGVADRMGISQVGEHPHCQLPPSQFAAVNAYVDKFLKGDLTVSTEIVKTDGKFAVEQSRWIDWPTPQLK